jgi:hypothetical protein
MQYLEDAYIKNIGCTIPSVMVHTCNPSTWETKKEYLEFEISQGYIKRYCLQGEKNSDLVGNLIFYLASLAVRIS